MDHDEKPYGENCFRGADDHGAAAVFVAGFCENSTVYYGFRYTGSEPLTVVLTGENSITLNGTEGEKAALEGFSSDADLVFAGGGSLTVTAGAAEYSMAVRSKGTISFNGGSICAASGEGQASSFAVSADHGINISSGSLTCESGKAKEYSLSLYSNGAVTVSGGSVTVAAANAQYSQAVWCDKGFELKDGVVNMTAGEGAGCSYGIYIHTGDAVISGGTLNTDGSVSGEWSCGIWCSGGLSLKDGTLNAASGKAKNASMGIYTQTKEITIDGGNLYTQAGEAEFSAGVYSGEGIIINGGEITAKAGDALTGKGGSVGIQGCKFLTINDGTVTALAGKACHESYGMNSVVINGGNITSMGGEIVGTSPEPEAWDYGGFGVDSTMTLNGGTVHISGHTRAVLNSVTTSLRGAGYTDAAGTEGQTAISAGDQEQKLEFLNVQFPVNMSFGK